MSHLLRAAVTAATITALIACSDRSTTIEPTSVSRDQVPAIATAPPVQTISVFDLCDRFTFDGNLGPTDCSRGDGVKFDEFIKVLTRLQMEPDWNFSPAEIHVKHGGTFNAINVGGEVHTFTEVKDFGGGRIQRYNNLSGNLVEAPECRELRGGDILGPGGTAPLRKPDRVGVIQHYQCCIHPWMRVNVVTTPA
jgi:hypothetical protein